MVYLSRIYTKTGDHGDTGLGDGSRVPKDHGRVTAYGAVDELNSVLGLFFVHLRESQAGPAMLDLIRGVQNDLFDAGADLCLPQKAEESPGQVLRGLRRAGSAAGAGDRSLERAIAAAQKLHPARRIRLGGMVSFCAHRVPARSATW